MNTLSAIVPTLNEARRIGDNVQALFDAGADEVVIVDGGSQDGTVEALAGSATKVISAPRGRSSQLNAGAQAANGDVLWFVHADTLVPADARAHISGLLSDKEVVAGAFRVRTRRDDAGVWAAPFLKVADFRSRWTWLPYGDQALFVRAHAFRVVGGYPDQPLMEDVEIARRLWGVGRLARVQAEVQVSGRRWLSQPVRTSIAWTTFPALYRAGVPSTTLARLYGNPR